MISAHYGLSDVFDNLVISLCKFTTLLSQVEVRFATLTVLTTAWPHSQRTHKTRRKIHGLKINTKTTADLPVAIYPLYHLLFLCLTYIPYIFSNLIYMPYIFSNFIRLIEQTTRYHLKSYGSHGLHGPQIPGLFCNGQLFVSLISEWTLSRFTCKRPFYIPKTTD